MEGAVTNLPEQRGARISACGLYRYFLFRGWDIKKPAVAFCMLNPSTADALNDDPTIRKVIGFAQRQGYGSVYVINLFAYRSTDPKLLKDVADPVGPENDMTIRIVLNVCKAVICAWGKHGSLQQRDLAVCMLFEQNGIAPLCLAVNQDGSPQHPLYIPYTAAPVPWESSPLDRVAKKLLEAMPE